MRFELLLNNSNLNEFIRGMIDLYYLNMNDKYKVYLREELNFSVQFFSAEKEFVINYLNGAIETAESARLAFSILRNPKLASSDILEIYNRCNDDSGKNFVITFSHNLQCVSRLLLNSDIKRLELISSMSYKSKVDEESYLFIKNNNLRYEHLSY